VNRTDILAGAVAFALALMIALAVAAWSVFRAPPAVPRPARAVPTTEDRAWPRSISLASVRMPSETDRRTSSAVTVVETGPAPVQPPQPQEPNDERSEGSGAGDGLEERLEEVVGVELGNLRHVAVDLVEGSIEGEGVVDNAVEPVGDLLSID
jgi:hypothetical protein